MQAAGWSPWGLEVERSEFEAGPPRSSVALDRCLDLSCITCEKEGIDPPLEMMGHVCSLAQSRGHSEHVISAAPLGRCH